MMGTDIFFKDRDRDRRSYPFPDPDPPFVIRSFADPDPHLRIRSRSRYGSDRRSRIADQCSRSCPSLYQYTYYSFIN